MLYRKMRTQCEKTLLLREAEAAGVAILFFEAALRLAEPLGAVSRSMAMLLLATERSSQGLYPGPSVYCFPRVLFWPTLGVAPKAMPRRALEVRPASSTTWHRSSRMQSIGSTVPSASPHIEQQSEP